MIDYIEAFDTLYLFSGKNNHISKNSLENDSYDSVGLFFNNVECQSQLFILLAKAS